MESSAQAQGAPRAASHITTAGATLGAYRPALAVITGVSVLGAITALNGLRRRTRGLAPARTELFLPARPQVGSLEPATVPAATGLADTGLADTGLADTGLADTGPERTLAATDLDGASATAPETTAAGDCWDEDGDCWDLVDA